LVVDDVMLNRKLAMAFLNCMANTCCTAILWRCLLAWALVSTSAWANGVAGEPPLWFEANRPSHQAQQAVTLLNNATAEGLVPAHYQAAELARAVAQARNSTPLSLDKQQQLDAALTRAVMRYLTDLRIGRVSPRQARANYDNPDPRTADTAALLRAAVGSQRLTEAAAQLAAEPPMASALRRALAQYQALAQHPAWQTPLPALPEPLSRKRAAGAAQAPPPPQPYTGLPLLAQRLRALGDLPPNAPLPTLLEGDLLAALVSFQTRHGLQPDGVLGRQTLQQLNVPPAQRAEQIALSLERLRWTPLRQAPRMVVVNVPEFVLRAYDVVDGAIHVKLSMKVIVGKALDTRTPLFDEAMRFIEFSPYWNIPPSIARSETIPHLRADPGYLARLGMEFVTPAGQVITHMAPQYLDAVLSGGWRIRQRPGPKNALGDIKFIFPNNDNIYLHHTPSPGLFERDRRDFSHGCIRVEEPVALAQFVLQDDPSWTEARIREAMTAGQSKTLRLQQPLAVLLAYSTVVVKGGMVFFYPDLYGLDQLLAKALRQHAATLPPPPAP
jgi:murein L,D-transpeptidase YcbB/YkuD